MAEMFILDTETTGLHNAGVCEIAWLHVDSNLNVLDYFHSLVNPEREIEPEAQAIHGISNTDVEFAPVLAEVAKNLPEGIDLIGHNCLTPDHEVLTREGWVRFDALGPTVEAAVWDASGAIAFAECLTVVKDYEGQMLKYSALYHTGVYTPQHKVVYSRANQLQRGLTWATATADAFSRLGCNSTVIPSAGIMEVADADISDNELRLLEAIRADAYIAVKTRSVRFKLKREDKKARLRYLLRELGMPFSENPEGREGVSVFGLLQHPMRDRIIELLCAVRYKCYDSWVLELSSRQRNILLEEIPYWDGSPAKGPGAQSKMTTADSKTAEWIQIMAVLSGKGSRLVLDKPNTRGFSRDDSVLSTVTVRKNNHVKVIDKPKSVDYTGKVHCLTTPTGFFVVRRNGVVWITGNCAFDMRMIKSAIVPARKLCTLELARQFIKGTTNHKLEVLQAELFLPEQKSHSALGDVHTTRDLLEYILKLTGLDLETVFARQALPKMLLKMPFGKHKGKPMLSVPKPYRQWLLGQEIDADLRYTLTRLELA